VNIKSCCQVLRWVLCKWVWCLQLQARCKRIVRDSWVVCVLHDTALQNTLLLLKHCTCATDR